MGHLQTGPFLVAIDLAHRGTLDDQLITFWPDEKAIQLVVPDPEFGQEFGIIARDAGSFKDVSSQDVEKDKFPIESDKDLVLRVVIDVQGLVIKRDLPDEGSLVVKQIQLLRVAEENGVLGHGNPQTSPVGD